MSDSDSVISGELLALVDSDDENKEQNAPPSTSKAGSGSSGAKKGKKGVKGRGKVSEVGSEEENGEDEEDEEENESSGQEDVPVKSPAVQDEKAIKGVATKRKRAAPKKALPTKKVKSDDEDDVPTSKSLIMYPLEGQYKDEADRERLLDMSEMQREEILAERQEELNKLRETAELDRMVKAREPAAVQSVVKRAHQGTGKTSEKLTKLEELKSIRKRKQERKARADSSSDEDDAGYGEHKAARRRTRHRDDDDSDESDVSLARGSTRMTKDSEPLTNNLLIGAQLTRKNAARWCLAPWFKELVVGTFVRYAIGVDPQTRQTQYRLCEIVDVQPGKSGKVYRCEGTVTNHQLLLRHGKAEKLFTMDAISNSQPTEQEYARWLSTCQHERVQMPRASDLRDRSAAIKKRDETPLTNDDFNYILARKSELSGGDRGTLVAEIARIRTARAGALAREDFATAARLENKINELETNRQSRNASNDTAPTTQEVEPDFGIPGFGTTTKKAPEMDRMKALAEINERNRKSSAMEVRQAEVRAAEERRRTKKAAGTATSADPFARVKTQVRLNFDSREATPSLSSGPPSPKLQPTPTDMSSGPGKGTDGSKITSDDAIVKSKNRYQQMVQNAGVAELDLGDF